MSVAQKILNHLFTDFTFESLNQTTAKLIRGKKGVQIANLSDTETANYPGRTMYVNGCYITVDIHSLNKPIITVEASKKDVASVNCRDVSLNYNCSDEEYDKVVEKLLNFFAQVESLAN